MSNRADLISHRTALQNLDLPLSYIEADVPSRNAASQIAKARAMVRAAEQLLAGALRERVDGMSDALDLPRHPQGRWGEEIEHDGGPQPDWIAADEWVGDDGYSAIASQRIWSKVRTFCLRADHPAYAIEKLQVFGAALAAADLPR